MGEGIWEEERGWELGVSGLGSAEPAAHRDVDPVDLQLDEPLLAELGALGEEAAADAGGVREDEGPRLRVNETRYVQTLLQQRQLKDGGGASETGGGASETGGGASETGGGASKTGRGE